jgi:hypothetical protein
VDVVSVEVVVLCCDGLVLDVTDVIPDRPCPIANAVVPASRLTTSAISNTERREKLVLRIDWFYSVNTFHLGDIAGERSHLGSPRNSVKWR